MGDHERAKKITSALDWPYSRRLVVSSSAIVPSGCRTSDGLASIRPENRSYPLPMPCQAAALWMHRHCESTTYVHGRERVASLGDNHHRNTEPVPESRSAAVHNIPDGRKNPQESCCCVTTRRLEPSPKTVPARLSRMDCWLNVRPRRRPLSSLVGAELLLGRGVFDSQPTGERGVDVWLLASEALLGDSGGFGNTVGSSVSVGTPARTPCVNRLAMGNVGKTAWRWGYAECVPWECHPVRARPGRLS